MKRVYLACIGIVATFLANAQSLSFGFEDWSDSIALYPYEPIRADGETEDTCYLRLVDNAEIIQDMMGNLSISEVVPGWSSTSHGLSRTTDAHSGDYAAIVHIWYTYDIGLLTYGNSGGRNLRSRDSLPKVQFENKLHGISGFYKYMIDSFMPGDVSGGSVTKLNVIRYQKNETGDLTIAAHDSLLFERSGAYKEFYLPLADTSIAYDSVSIVFSSAGGFNSCSYAHFLYLDDIQFHFEPYILSTGTPALPPSFRLYPNPAKDRFNLEYDASVRVTALRLTDLTGRVVKSFNQGEKVLDINGIAQGMYLLQLKTDKGLWNEKIVIE